MRLLAGLCLWLAFATAALAQDAFFETGPLNTGLGAAPADLDRLTPQSAIESFLDAGKARDFARASHLLNLSDFEDNAQPDTGQDLAHKLYELFDRKVVINWAQLLDRPDALDANATSDSAVAGQVRRSLLLEKVTLDDRMVAIRLNRFKPPEGDPVWLFSPQTVDNIDALHALYGPSKLELMLPAALRTEAILGLKWWELVALPLVLILSALLGIAVRSLLREKADEQRRDWYRRVLKAVRTPITVFVTTGILAFFTTTLFTFSGPVDQVVSPLIVLGFVIAALLLIMNVLDAVLDRIVARDLESLSEIEAASSRDLATKVSAFRRAAIVVIFLLGSGIVLSSAGVFNSLGYSLLASAGAVTLILGFAARNVLGNIMASMQIALNRSAKIGDKIVFRGDICNVERINFTYVQLRIWTGTRLVVPVEEFVSEPFENWTMKDPNMIRLIVLKLAHDADIDAMRQAFSDILDTVDEAEMADRDDAKVVVDGQDVFGIDVTFCLPCANPNTAWELSCEVREKLIDAGRSLSSEERPTFPQANPAEAV